LATCFAIILVFCSNKLAELFGKENQWDSLAFVGAFRWCSYFNRGADDPEASNNHGLPEGCCFKQGAADEVMEILTHFSLGLEFSNGTNEEISDLIQELHEK
jgi:hypothetical protein